MRRALTDKDFQGRPDALSHPLVGGVFGRWTVLSVPWIRKKQVFALCRCECGKEVRVNIGNLKSGGSISCGCFLREITKARSTKHGACPRYSRWKKSYRIWTGMTKRCRDVNSQEFHDYGGRGIYVCARWLGPDGYANFVADLGEPSEEMSLERKDVNGGYCPENCCWIPWRDQSKNRRHNWRIKYGEGILTAADFARRVGKSPKQIDARARYLGLDKTQIHDASIFLR